MLGVYYIFGASTDNSVLTVNNSTVTTNSSSNVADNSADIDKTIESFTLDQNQELVDFDSETADKSQIKVESTDLLNLSQSYETNDF